MLNETISHYRVTEKLGSGGMGVVFRAEDTRLGRSVALKFLPEEYSRDQQALERFQFEARAASALNHPNICTIYDVGKHNDQPFIVMELMKGETLKRRIGGKPLELEQALEFAIQIGSALDVAHRQGIIHRDVKPGNIFVTELGQAKIMDFGLAKLLSEAEVSASDSDSERPTARPGTGMMTTPGTTLGTVAYMSPEQARGEELDARTDVFSFGDVLFEMITGQVPFQGTTAAVVFNEIFNKTPVAPSTLNPEIPAALDLVISKALEKDRDLRYQSAAELLVDLKRIRRDVVTDRTSSRRGMVARALPSRIAGKRVPFPFLALLFLLFIVAGVWYFGSALIGTSDQTTPFQSMRQVRLTSTGNAHAPAISPDGRYVVHVLREGGRSSVWVRQVATGSNVQVLPPSDEFYLGFTFSPDSNFIYYVKGRRGEAIRTLLVIPSLGGPARQVLQDVDCPVAFSPDGSEFAFIRHRPADYEDQIVIARLDGSSERVLTQFRIPERLERQGLSWSPDGKKLAVGRLTFINPTHSNIIEIDVKDGKVKEISGSDWLMIGKVVWDSDGRGLVFAGVAPALTYWSQLWHIEYPDGRVERITNDLYNYESLSVAADSSRLVSVQYENQGSLWLLSLEGERTERQISGTQEDGLFWPSFADEEHLVFVSLSGGNPDVWSIKLDGTNRKQLTLDAGVDTVPVVSPDGRNIVFVSLRSGVPNLWAIDIDGANLLQLTHGQADVSPYFLGGPDWVAYISWNEGSPGMWKVPLAGGEPVKISDQVDNILDVSRDGNLILYRHWNAEANNADVRTLNLQNSEEAFVFEVEGKTIRFTPDGKAIAYIKNENGISNVWVQPLDGSAPKTLTSFTDDKLSDFCLSSDATTLVFVRSDIVSDVVMVSDF